MRIWDQIDPALMCNQHLLGEHRELHGLFNIHYLNRKGYSKHPETVRWAGRLPALRSRHEALVAEMRNRGWKSGSNHATPLPLTEGCDQYPKPMDNQIEALKSKGCQCRLSKNSNGQSVSAAALPIT